MVHNHMFPAANTGLAAIRGDDEALEAEKAFLKDNIRVELFGIRENVSIDGVFSEGKADDSGAVSGPGSSSGNRHPHA